MTKTVLPAFWRVILCLTLFPLASAAMHSYEPNAARWLVFTLPYKTFPFTTTPSVSLLPPLYNVMVIGGTPPLNAQTNLTPNPLKDLTIIGVLFRLSEASGSTAKKKKNLKYDLLIENVPNIVWITVRIVFLIMRKAIFPVMMSYANLVPRASPGDQQSLRTLGCRLSLCPICQFLTVGYCNATVNSVISAACV